MFKKRSTARQLWSPENLIAIFAKEEREKKGGEIDQKNKIESASCTDYQLSCETGNRCLSFEKVNRILLELGSLVYNDTECGVNRECHVDIM